VEAGVVGGGGRQFRFGVVGESIRSAGELVAAARLAEELGYSTLLLRDHFQREPFGDQLAPLVALMAAASATRTVRVGTLIADNDYRHPVLLAKEAATVDVLSGGRFELGIGAAERLAAGRGWAGLPVEQVLDMPSILVGTADRIAEQLRARRDRYGLSYVVVSDQDMMAFSPVVQSLAGT
jgi:alkanesulfonate monooxygenase SsuD/methylene tetrahydromethanopterin reductase-like flavin-dependent oxidoreductase (luciferase family)